MREALDHWAGAVALGRPEVRRIGYFGSYARGDWGVGSDVDIIVVLDRSEVPFERRGVGWDTSALPVPVDLLIYTEDEWRRVRGSGRFSETVAREIVWLLDS